MNEPSPMPGLCSANEHRTDFIVGLLLVGYYALYAPWLLVHGLVGPRLGWEQQLSRRDWWATAVGEVVEIGLVLHHLWK